MEPGELPLQAQTLRPLPPSLHSGLLTIFILASLSFSFALCLFCYLSYKLIVWRLVVRRRQDKEFKRRYQIYLQQRADHDHAVHNHTISGEQEPTTRQAFSLGIDGLFRKERSPGPESPEFTESTSSSKDGTISDEPEGKKPPSLVPPPPKPVKSAPNQFIILIYNLLLADLHQSLAFLFNGRWVHRNGILVGTPVCFTQGIFVSTGDLSSSLFITLVAVHTYLSVVRNYQVSQKKLYCTIGLTWFFVYFITFLPIIITRNGASTGGFIVRAVAWCWVSESYESVRLLTQYLWIFIALVITSGLYIAIWLHLRSQARDPNQTRTSYNPAFLIYPVIYIMCTLPLALGRVLTMVHVDLPTGYFCFAGAMISCNGFFDCLLFGTTRHAIIFGSKYSLDDQEAGIKTIAFLQTPSSRVYGNMVWIQGGDTRVIQEEPEAGGWWSFKRLHGKGLYDVEQKGRGLGSAGRLGSRGKHKLGTSQESLRGIQMDLVTSVVVEVEGRKRRAEVAGPGLDHLHTETRSRAASVGSPSVSLDCTETRPRT